MSKNILIFADGTGQAGGLRPDQRLSNIYKLFRATRPGPENCIDPRDQVAFYDPGLGTATEAGIIRLKWLDRVKRLAELAAGTGISTNVVDCYEAILRRYEPGDRIFLFGFSRGAYTVRSVAGVLNLCGVPTTNGKGEPIRRSGPELRSIAEEAVQKVYDHGAGKPREKFEEEREEQGRRFRSRYGVAGDEHRASVTPYFVGVFDSVAALGLPRGLQTLLLCAWLSISIGISWAITSLATSLGITNGMTAFVALAAAILVVTSLLMVRGTFKYITHYPKRNHIRFHFARWNKQNYDAFLDPRISAARHALSIDERRKDFPRVIWGSSRNVRAADPGEPEPFKQIWFAGNHSDIGGSYPEEESRLSDVALDWMVSEAQTMRHPLLVDDLKLRRFPDPLGAQHCEIQEFLDGRGAFWPRAICWPEAPRSIPADAVLHPSVFQRLAARQVMQAGNFRPYRPESLASHHIASTYFD